MRLSQPFGPVASTSGSRSSLLAGERRDEQQERLASEVVVPLRQLG